VNFGVPGSGVVHPLTQLAVAWPCVGGGVAGVAGGVGEVVGDPGLTGAGGDVDVGEAGWLPSQTDSVTAMSIETPKDQMNLRKPPLRADRGPDEDTDGAVPW
jgi:hypothetical protein